MAHVRINQHDLFQIPLSQEDFPFKDGLYPPLVSANCAENSSTVVFGFVVFCPEHLQGTFTISEEDSNITISGTVDASSIGNESRAWFLTHNIEAPANQELTYTVTLEITLLEQGNPTTEGRKTSRGTKVTVKTSQPGEISDS